MLRRTLLVVPTLGSLLGLALVVAPTVGITDPGAPPPVRISQAAVTAPSRVVDTGWSKVVSSTADLVGVRWRGDPTTTFTIESRDERGNWSDATEVGVPDFGPDPGSAEARRHPTGNVSEPVWVGNANAVRIRVARGSAQGVDMEQVEVPRASSSAVAGAAAPRPGIISRAQWGADESLRLANCPEGPGYDTNVELAIIHHTAGSNNYGPGDSPAIVRGLYAYATRTLQYCDIHYNFLVDRFGQVFEGRYGGVARAVHGAHAVGFNTDTTGIAAIGNFQTTPAPSAMVDAITNLVAWKFDVHGVDPTRTVRYVTYGNDRFPAGTALNLWPVIGHGDTWFTSCPGQYLWSQLGRIRTAASVIMASHRGWTGWNPLGGSLTSAPASASWAGNRIDLFANQSGGALGHKWWDGQSWSSGWQPLPSPPSRSLASTPAAVSWGPNRVDVFVTATDGSLRHTWGNGTQWNAWENLGGTLTSAPTVVSWAPNRIDVFARASDGSLQHTLWDGQSWWDWESLGGGVVGTPTATSWAPNRIDVFVRGTDHRLYHRFFAGRWVGWESLGGGLTSSPSASAWGPGRIDVFVRGTDLATWHRWWDGARWQPFESLGGVLTSDPSALSKSWIRVDLFVRGTDNQVWSRTFG